MPPVMRLVLRTIFATCLATYPVQASSQSAGGSLTSISEEQFLHAISLIRPTPQIKKRADSYDLTLPNGIPANAELQNCDDKKKLLNCRTLSIIVNLEKPKGNTRSDLLALANQLNTQDIHGRTFVNDDNDLITRFSFFVTGNESSSGLAVKLINWDSFVRNAVLSLYSNSEQD